MQTKTVRMIHHLQKKDELTSIEDSNLKMNTYIQFWEVLLLTEVVKI